MGVRDVVSLSLRGCPSLPPEFSSVRVLVCGESFFVLLTMYGAVRTVKLTSRFSPRRLTAHLSRVQQ